VYVPVPFGVFAERFVRFGQGGEPTSTACDPQVTEFLQNQKKAQAAEIQEVNAAPLLSKRLS